MTFGTLFPKDPVSVSETASYRITYIACSGEYFRGPSGKFDQQPSERVTVRGHENYRVTARAIRDAGGKIVKVRQRGK